MTQQQPIGSGFGASTTANEVIHGIDLRGKVAIVTGGSSGIGLPTTRALRSAGARVIVPARNYEKAAAALQGIDGVEIEEMDLSDPTSIDAFAERFLATGQPLHILVNSAGIGDTMTLRRDARGYELCFATNHLGHFQLTMRLYPALRQAKGARVVAVSAWAHSRSPIVFEDIHFEHRDYRPGLAYGQSKTANILFAKALDERGMADGLRAFSLHPGSIVDTGLSKHLSPEILRSLGLIDENGTPIIDPARNMKTAEQGAATSVWCATSPQLDGMGGVYCQNCDIAPLVPAEVETNQMGSFARGVAQHAIDKQSAGRLWKVSEQLLGWQE
ncbi:SDR family NAD(P)-dependent oxidoreductase [Ktedonospora formicarum]|uniref:Probable oxidoreductase n=1 Tax=Ktedonospora formicarum TaxID=2778364 RepID=A0A8J3IBQ1_9CHLR|nr:SDR family NAD(P)-dependent oxidoreductase [Ktedonospora formicarum]GHO51023.1 oxidoreductase [Ktedonospora formicarum]